MPTWMVIAEASSAKRDSAHAAGTLGLAAETSACRPATPTATSGSSQRADADGLSPDPWRSVKPAAIGRRPLCADAPPMDQDRPKLSRVTLAFSAPYAGASARELERAYLDDSFERSLGIVRIGCL